MKISPKFNFLLLRGSYNPYLFRQFSWRIRYVDVCPLWRCDARCPTCGAWKRQAPELSFEQAKRFIEYFTRMDRVVIEGGEPTLWEHLEYFVQNVDSKHVMIISHGMNPGKISYLARKFSPEKVHWLISLNGIGKTHDASRGVKGAYPKTMKSIKLLKKLGYTVNLSFVGFQENIDEYPKVRAKAEELGCHLDLCFPVGNVKFGEWMKWHFVDYERILQIQRNNYLTGRTKRLNRLAKKKFIEGVAERKLLPCFAGKSMAHINPFGIIRPCCWDETMEIGKITDGGVFIDEKKRREYQKTRIPQECQYTDGRLCGDCFVHFSIRSSLII